MFNLSDRADCRPIRNILPGVILRNYQAVNAVRMVVHDYRLILFNTGLGKTLTAISGLVMRTNCGKSRRILWICPLSTVRQTLSDLQRYTEYRIRTIRGTQDSAEKATSSDISAADLVLVNFEAFDNKDIIWFFQRLSVSNVFDTVVIDEAHWIADPFYSNRNSFVYMLAYRINSRYILTATPIISEMNQYAALIALASQDLHNLFHIRARIHSGEFKPENAAELVGFKTRDEVVEIEPVIIDRVYDVDSAPGVSVFNHTRGGAAAEVNAALMDLIRTQGSSRFLIHCHLTKNHKFLQDLLWREMGLRAGIISGKAKNPIAVKKRFEEGSLDCIIFSITTGINLPAKYTVMYDWTVYAAQAMGRGLRTEEVKDYKVFLITTTTPKELSLLQNSVIKHGLITEKALGYNPLLSLKGKVSL